MTRSSRNPLAPGIYRVDFAPELARVFGHWRRNQRGKVHVLNLEDSPVGGARVSFVVFARPGAFPFGQLGHPEQATVGALPDWSDVLSFIVSPLGHAQAYLAREVGQFLGEHAAAAFEPLRAAVTQVKVNIATVERDLESVRNGTAPNPSAVLHNSMELVSQSIELLLAGAAHVPGEFNRGVVNELLRRLHELRDAIESAPRKALHSIAEFGEKLLDPLKPALWPLLGLALVAGGAFLAFEDRKVTPLTKNLMLAGGAVVLLGGAPLFASEEQKTLFANERHSK